MNTTAIETKEAKTKKETFPVLKMSCAACAVSVESMLKATAGVKDAAVNFANQTAWVEYEEGTVKPANLQNAVRSIGYDLVVDVQHREEVQEKAQQQHLNEIKKRTLWSLILTLPVVILGMFFMDWQYANYFSLLLSAPVIFYFGRSFFFNAWKQARFGKANMDTLVALSTGIAFFFSVFNTFFPEFWHSRGLHAHVYYEAAAVVIAFISLGKLLEEKAKSSTSSAIKKLMGLQPKTIKVIINGGEQEIPISSVKVGNIVQVHPGEKIAVDGIVTNGSSYVDESMISGEPIAVEKASGHKVFAGTINEKGSFRFEAMKVGEDTVLAHIIKMVQQAQGSKAPVQKLVDKVAGIFVPAVIAIAVITFIAWLILGGENAFTHALLTSITVLVIACPCALGLATPTAIMVGIGKGAENNILIKDAESLELAHKVDVVILDKTGTITEGKPVVTDLVWYAERQEQELLANILYSIESRSEHPLAQAVAAKLKETQAQHVHLSDFSSLTGRGAEAQFNNILYSIGNRRLLDSRNISIPASLDRTVSAMEVQAKTVVYFTNDKSVLSLIAIADKIKETSKEAIASMKHRGIEVYMLTGDNELTAKAVSEQVGITHYKAQLMPDDKATFVKALQEKGRIVAMVGDGINDSHALAQADVSIAMGKGSDIAMDVAKMTLITSDLRSVPKALNLSSNIVRGIRQNLFWAFIYNLIGIPLAAGLLYPVNGFLLNPMIAGAAMALSSVSVVSNSLRLKLKRI
ncbi:MAG TPA: heavy metal translocating P-type ATPase [Chryseolinea sp.]|nr:heavy metal translocating P-type ATPase [Chryseolinea sp.]